MLYPQNNHCRTVFDLSGIWDLKIDKEGSGEQEKWYKGFIPDAQIGIPGSWNEQLAEHNLMHYIGHVWLQTRFSVPEILKDRQHFIQFGSADFNARVWINGQYAGEHEGGFLPFEFDISSFVLGDEPNLLIVCVDNALTKDTIPQGLTYDDHINSGRIREQTFPLTTFDFLPYGGLNRPVKLITVDQNYIDGVSTNTGIEGKSGWIDIQISLVNPNNSGKIKFKLFELSELVHEKSVEITSRSLHQRIMIKQCKFWHPDNPFLYRLKLELDVNDQKVDEYEINIGVREITVTDSNILINGTSVFLKGFGKHEDFDIIGKGLSNPLLIKDFELLKWIGANSFRTAHYPYAEEVLQLADQYGFLVIDEVPAVSLNFKYVTPKTLENHKRAIAELVARDRNHASVICWCLGNEPGIWGELEANSEKADKYWAEIFSYTRQLDDSRPLTVPAFPHWQDNDLVFKFSDFLSINRYWGWYQIPADLPKAARVLDEELRRLHKKYNKPVLVSEFGADTIEGAHATYTQMFTEEFQTQFIETYFRIIEGLSFTIGEHIWNFADFMTAQNFRRVILNKKGVFNRQRQPKAAAFAIKKHWQKMPSEK